MTDKTAIWSFNSKNGKRSVLAPFGNISADETPRPILHLNGKIYLGLTQGGQGKVIGVDVKTGQAKLIKQYATGPITTLALQNEKQIWVGLGNGLTALSNETNLQPIEASAPLKGMAFMPSGTNLKDWPESTQGALFISQGQTHSTGSGGYNIIAVQSQFGAISQKAAVIADGFFRSRSNRIWAKPESLLFDTHGLLVGDRLGTLWRIKTGQKELRQLKARFETPEVKTPKQKPSAERGVTTPMQGSLIGSASQLNKGSHLKVGSTLIEKHEAEKAAKEEVDAKEKGAED